jgi:peptidyl-prolyl cis-trans isomerase SurA
MIKAYYIKRMRFTFFVLLCSLLALSLSPVQAREEGIAAVVNQDVISMTDLGDRMRLILVSSGLPNAPEVREKVGRQVIDSLIEEQLMMQEAGKQGVEVSESEIDQGFAALAAQNKIPSEEFKKMVQGSGVNLNTMRRQIKAQMGWTKVIQKVMRPKITVTDGDIDEYLGRIKANTGKEEYLLAEIFLPVSTPDQENDTRQLAQKLVVEIRDKKAPFQKVAQQFSRAPGAQSTGGLVGWMPQDQIPQEQQSAVLGLQENQITDPIRASDGYHIVALLKKRAISAETLPSRDDVVSAIGVQRLDRMQRSYLMDLKSSAFIENRVES